MLMALSGPSRPPVAGGKPRRLVILVHGLGADGNDLIGLQQYWGSLVPEAEFVSPNAPFPCDMAPYGYQWFSVQDRSPAAVLGGVRAAASLLQKRGLEESDAALVGFSQGTMMALFVGLRRAKPLAGILGYSGRLIAPDLLSSELRSRPPVLLVHGTEDPLVPEAEFVSPNAPFPCDMAPYGYQWFSVQDRSPAAVLGGVRAAASLRTLKAWPTSDFGSR